MYTQLYKDVESALQHFNIFKIVNEIMIAQFKSTSNDFLICCILLLNVVNYLVNYVSLTTVD